MTPIQKLIKKYDEKMKFFQHDLIAVGILADCKRMAMQMLNEEMERVIDDYRNGWEDRENYGITYEDYNPEQYYKTKYGR